MNNLTVTAGTFNIATTAAANINGSVSIASGATLGLTGAGVACSISGNWSNSGTFTPGTSTVTFNGSSQQQYTRTGTGSLNNLTLNNAAGLLLNNSLTVNGTLAFTSGNITTGSNSLIVGSGGTVSRTSGHVIGNLQRTFTAAGSLTFDVGTANGYSPVAVNAVSGAFPANFTISATQGKLPQISGTNALARYWTLTNTSVTNANLTFTYLASDVTGTVSNYQFVKRSGENLTILAPATTPTSTQATINGVSSFSDWTLAEPSAVQSGTLQFSSATYSDSETNTTHNKTITVTRAGGTDGAVSVDYATSDGTATAGSDYTAASGTLNWAAGDSASKTFNVSITGDTTFEPDETVNLTLSNPTGGASLGSPNTAVLTITNDDAAPPTLGNYTGTAVALGANTTVTPDAAPTGATAVSVSTSTNFKGVLTVNPTSGVVSVTNAQPAGAYTVTVKATGAGGTTTKSFTLTVQSGTACTGTTTFTNAANVLVGNGSFYAAVGDFNGDSNQDLLVSNQSSGTVSVRLGAGDGTFGGTTDVTVGSGPKWVAVGDFNNDGKQDFAVANATSNTVSVRLGVGNGTFTNASDISTGAGTRPWAIAAGDFNGDGKQDLAITEAFQSRVEIRTGDGAGGFAFSNFVTVGTDFSTTSANAPSSIAIGDFNGDGKQDLAVGNRNAGSMTFVPTVSIRLGVGDGTFTGTTEVPVATFSADPLWLALGDFNSDGKQDLVTANSQTNTLSVRIGDGAGNFSGTTEVSVGSGPLSVAVADFNNDGKQDLLTANTTSSDASLALGDGAGNFAAATSVSTGSGPQAVAVGDFNEDGKLDFAAPGNSTLTFVRLGTCNVAQPGTIQFSSATYSDSETNSDHTFSATVTRTGGSSGAVSVDYSVTDGTATVSGGDYTVASATGTLSWADGDSSSKTIDITVKGDLNIEPDETVNFAISNPQGGATLGSPSSAVLTITNDDAETAVSPSGGNLTITDGNGGTSNDALTLTINGNSLRIHDPNNTLSAGPGATQVDPNTVDVPLNLITGQITVNTGGGNDALTLNFSNGNFLPPGGLTYNGGSQTSVPPGDTLAIVGGNQGAVTYNYTNANDGQIVMSNFGTVTYTGLEPITNSGTATDVVFNLPAGPNNVTLGDDGTSGNTLSRLSAATFETTDFANPTGSVTINRGSASDNLTVNALPDFNASLTLGSGANPFSQLSFNGAVTLASNKNLSGDASSVLTIGANLTTSGTGTITLTTTRNILVSSGAVISVVNGNLTLNANTAATNTAPTVGIIITSASTLTTSGTGNISLNGKGGSSAGSGNHRGLNILGASTISSTSSSAGAGTITLNGTGGQGTLQNYGVEIQETGTSVTSVVGDISITGQGGAGTSNNNFGVQAELGAVVSSTGAAKININGTGGTSTTGIGVRVANDTTQVTSSGGDITITGQGANGGSGNFGVSIAFGGLVNATGGAKININGTGGTGTGSLSGVIVSNFDAGTNAPSRVTSNSGDINITGIAGGGTSSGNIGINTDTSARITATGAANITLNGTGGAGSSDCYGIGFEGGDAAGTGISAVNGNITLNGTGGPSAGTDMDGVRFEDSFGAQSVSVTTTGTGTLTINGTAGNTDATSAGINIVDDTTMSLTGATNSFIADTMDFGTSNASVNAGANSLTLRQKTNGIVIDLGGTDSTAQLGLTDTELDIINAATLNIGNANSGAITVSTAITRAASTALNLTSGGAINLNASSLDSGGGNVSLTPGSSAAVNPTATGTDVSMSTTGTLAFVSGADLAIQINGTTVDTQYRQLNVVGGVNLTGVDLVLSGSHTPAAGQSFIIVNNDGADAVTGTFNGLAEGASIPNFLGSALTAKITYVGGDGNDVVISIPTPPKYRSKQSGNWNDFNTWEVDTGGGFVPAVAGQTPTSADDTIQIRSPHTVTVTANVDADQLTVDSGATLSVAGGVTFTIADGTGTDLADNGTVRTAGQITNNGQAVINDTLQIDEGGFPGGGTGTYAYDQTAATLVFNNTSGSYGVGNDNYWPATNGPQNVNVKGAGGITMNVARTVGILFQYAAGVTNAGNLTLNGTSQVNTGGFMSGSPTYGSSSLLKYNTGGTYGRNGEWLPNVTSGAGYPANVQLSNNTNLNLPNGAAGAFFQMSGTLTIDSGSTMNLNGSPAMTQPLNVLGSVNIGGTLTLSSASGGDIKVGGDWTRTTGTFNPNGRAVFFNGASTQTIARASTGQIETFDYLVVDKSGGNLTLSSSPATNVIVTGPSGGSALQIINAGGIDLGSSNNGLTLNGSVAGTNILVGGASAPATRTVTGTGTFGITGTVLGGDKSVTNNNGKTLTFDTGVNLVLNKGMDFGALLTTLNGTLTIGGGGSVINNGPTYGPASTLLYNCTCVYARNAEWTGATSGPGAPNNVTVNTNTDLDLGSTTPGTALQAAGNLTVNSGARALMSLDNDSHAMTSALTVLKDVLVNTGGTLRLSIASGGDLNVGGNFTDNGTFTANGRTTTFIGPQAQTISGSSAITFHGVTMAATTSTVQSAVNFNVTGNWLDLTGAYVPGTETITFNGTSPQTIGGSSPSHFASIDLNNAAGVSLTGNEIVNGNLGLTGNDLVTGTNVLIQPATGSSSGTFDVVGNVQRLGIGTNTPRTFGNPNNRITITAGTPPTNITVNLVKSRPTGAGFGFPSAVNRTYTITPTGGSGFTATLRLHYNDSDLSGNPPVGEEALLDLWRFDGARWQRIMKTNADPIDNWVESNAVTQFSPWTLSATPLAPTASRLESFNATSFAGGVALEWQTGFEADNLGFRIFREDGARRTLVTPSVIAGSALTVGDKTALGAGNSYRFVDRGGSSASRYFLEDIALDGKSTLQGPFWPTGASRGWRPKQGTAVPLSEVGEETYAQQHQWIPPAVYANGKQARKVAGETQTSIASMRAVKLQVRRAGWYRVTRAQLEAAGLSSTADPVRLQLFADGVEQAVCLDASAWSQNGRLEFYGEGVDKPSTDTRVYWLVEGSSPGRRMTANPANAPASDGDDTTASDGDIQVPGGVITLDPIGPPAGTTSFPYTIERRDRNVYFSSLLNGDGENFFGRVITNTTGAQTLTVRNHEDLDSATTRLEVAVQGVTTGQHTVEVFFNGSQIGTLEFAGRERKTATFDVPGGWVAEGDNSVRLVSSTSGDVSITDYMRLTYMHLMRADDDALRLSAEGGTQIRVSGFTTTDVRVVDVTDPSNAVELPVTVTDWVQGEASGNTASFTVAGGGERRLLAFGENRVEQVAGALAHAPSDWRDAGTQADFVIITHANFRQAIEPLAAKRRAEGLATKVVDVEDLYDEFSAGEHTAQAVRDALEYASKNWARAPRYVLLVGDGSYDPRNFLGFGAFDLVPAKLVDTAQMETASDSWLADFDADGLADIAIGRLPVRTASEATTVVTKIVNNVPVTVAPSAVLVADRNGVDGYSFESATDTVQSLLPADVSVARINRGTQSGDSVRAQIVSAVNAGPQIVNWMGHGSISVWTGDGLLRSEDAAALQNSNRLSLFVMMTCLNGYFASPGVESLSESLLKAEQGGALAAWTSTGMTEPTGQVEINRELYRALYDGGGALRLGDAMRRAGAATADKDVRRTWVLIGDPTARWK